jgi:ABC-type glycerol-3-phosphate transport system permease component
MAVKILKVLLITGIIALALAPFYLWLHSAFAPPTASAVAENITPVVVGTTDLRGSILLTFLYAIPTALIAAFIHTLLAFGLAYGLARGYFPLREELRLICFLALFIPATLIIGSLYDINFSLGIQGNFVAAFLAMWSLPWLAALLYFYLLRLPQRMELYAAADGMTPKQIFTELILPYSYKGLIAIFLLSFLINYHSLFAAAASLPEGSFASAPSPSFSYLPVMLSIFRQPSDIISPSAKLLAALIFQIPSFLVLPPLLIYGIPMLRTILTGKFGMRRKRGIV